MSKLKRCSWAGSDPLYVEYHDKEWGVPVHDEHKHFEFLILESAQAGLSWLTILKRRKGYRRAFAEFNPNKVADFNEKDKERLLQDEGIIRNRLKINSAINNAKVFLSIQSEFGSFDSYIWQFVKGKPVQNYCREDSQVPASTPLSDKVSADLKSRGMSFVGTTIMYAHLQATGLVNDHTVDCFRHKLLKIIY